MTVRSALVIRARAIEGYALSRVTALLTAGVAVLLAVELVTDNQVKAYDVALVGTAAVGALGTAAWLWHRNCFEARVTAVVLATLVLVGQLLVSVVGVPGGPTVAWSGPGIAVVVLAVAIAALVTADARRSWPPERIDPPYAL